MSYDTQGQWQIKLQILFGWDDTSFQIDGIVN